MSNFYAFSPDASGAALIEGKGLKWQRIRDVLKKKSPKKRERERDGDGRDGKKEDRFRRSMVTQTKGEAAGCNGIGEGGIRGREETVMMQLSTTITFPSMKRSKKLLKSFYANMEVNPFGYDLKGRGTLILGEDPMSKTLSHGSIYQT